MDVFGRHRDLGPFMLPIDALLRSPLLEGDQANDRVHRWSETGRADEPSGFIPLRSTAGTGRALQGSWPATTPGQTTIRSHLAGSL
jgi:hypothetical protein